MILDSVIENLEAEGLLQQAPRSHVVLGYSGGADSTALLFLLGEIRKKRALDITAAYFNHRWRGTPPEELPLVHRNCVAAGVPLVVIQADLNLPHTENAARYGRYRQLTQLAYDLHASAVLTAHHADDQIETLLFRILRGTGIDGLSGIQKRLLLEPEFGAPVPVLRPLLDVARKTIREYLTERNLTYFDDPTNQDTKKQRNHIRRDILPVLESAFPQVKNSLFRLSLVSEGDLRIIEDVVDGIWATAHGKDATGVYLDAVQFNQLGLPYQRRILKRFLNGQDIHTDFQTIEDLLMFIRGEGRKNLDSSLKSLVKGADGRTRFLALYKNRLRLIAAPEAVTPVAEREVASVSIPGPVVLDKLAVTLFVLPWQAPEKVKMSPIRPNDSQQVFVNLSAFVDQPLVLRCRRPGDQFQPMGMNAPLRFKKFLINRGVPRFERDSLPVLACGSQILWAPGLGISELLRIKPKATPTHLLQLLPGTQHAVPVLRDYSQEGDDEDEDMAKPASSDDLEPLVAADELLAADELIVLEDSDEISSAESSSVAVAMEEEEISTGVNTPS